MNGQTGEKFIEIVGNQLKLKAGQSLNHEAEPTVDVVITTTDAGGNSYNETITLNVADINEGPTDISLTGGNGLLDKLVQMGLLPQEQAMGARMMMGLFMVPGEGEDTLTSRIEVRPDGQVLANGQRLR